jgi:Protein of unknown function (DUF4238)
MKEARKHHFVPEFLLRPWCLEGMLQGYWWDDRRGALACKRKGAKGFCWRLDLLALRAHSLGRDALERVFFGHIDTKGAAARDRLVADGPRSLNVDERCDFTRLMLSLDIRRPAIVATLRDAGSRHIAASLDGDPQILAAMESEGLAGPPSSYVEQLGICLEDRALATIQQLIDNPKIGGSLINAHWHMVRLGPTDGTLVLSDRPLIRIRGYDHPGAAWVLPLTPKAAFVAVNHQANLDRIKRITSQRFARRTNVSSAVQAERFVFCVEKSHERWIAKYLSEDSRLGHGMRPAFVRRAS